MTVPDQPRAAGGRTARPARSPGSRPLVQLAQAAVAARIVMSEQQPGSGSEVVERTRTRTREPSMWKVVLLNDDYTPMEFVVYLLESIFEKSPAEAYRVMMLVHTEGRGLCGVYPFEVAETRAARTEELAQSAGYPLKAVVEEE